MTMSEEVALHIPFLRRYARALMGSQESGDAYVVATLESLIAAPEQFSATFEPRVALYCIFHAIWSSSAIDVPEAIEQTGNRLEVVAKKRLSALTPMTRQALLLTAMEGFTREQAASILRVEPELVADLLREAIADIDRQTATSVLIIEDEPIIAMDLEEIVRSLGHKVSGVARTRDAAVDSALERRPGLVLADIQLADGSSGIDAVRDILRSFEVPVIFITAYPERLLTGRRPEPTFLITKPFQTETVKAAISQALFFETSSRLS